MSYTLLKSITPQGLVESTGFKYRNSHGFQPFVWSHMSQKYFHDDMHWLMAGIRRTTTGTGECRSEDPLKSFWDLWKRPSIPMHERSVFMSTFDTALIEAAMFPRMIEDFRKFYAEALKPNVVCHIPQICEDLLKLPKDSLGAGFYGTSITEDCWIYNENLDADGERIDEPYDINKGAKHFFVFTELDKLPSL